MIDLTKRHPAIAKATRPQPSRSAVIRRLQGQRDARGLVGEISRGKTTYLGGSSAAHRGGGPQYGRPKGAKDNMPLMSAARRKFAARNRRR